jgi:hypothetical protein
VGFVRVGEVIVGAKDTISFTSHVKSTPNQFFVYKLYRYFYSHRNVSFQTKFLYEMKLVINHEQLISNI